MSLTVLPCPNQVYYL